MWKKIIIPLIIIFSTVMFAVVWKNGKDKPAQEEINHSAFIQEKASVPVKAKIQEEKTEEKSKVDWQAEDLTKWTSYRNDKIGGEIKHPSDWKIVALDDPSAGVAFRSPYYEEIKNSSGTVIYDGEIYFSCTLNKNNSDIKDAFQSYNDTSAFWFKNFKYDNLKIGPLDAVFFPEIREGSSSLARAAYFIKGDRQIINLQYEYKDKDDRVFKILDMMAKSFRERGAGCGK